MSHSVVFYNKGGDAVTRSYDSVLVEEMLNKLGLNQQFDCSLMSFSVCRFSRGELLSSPLHVQTDILFLYSGKVQFYAIRPDGQQIPVNLGKRGAVIGDVEFAGNGTTALYSEAMTESVCLALNLEKNGQILNQNTSFLKYLLRVLCSKVYLVSSQNQVAISVEDKLLLHLQARCREMPLCNISELAKSFGCSRRQLERVIHKLCAGGQLRPVRKGCYEFMG